MRKLSILISAMLIATSGMAADWKLTDIKDSNRSVVGYIYHTEAVGSHPDSKQKFVTGMRFVCSRDEKLSPVIAIYWNTLMGAGFVYPSIKVDNRSIGGISKWDRDGPLLLRQASDSAELIQAMKVGKTVRVEWDDNGKRYQTVFDLLQFRAGLNEFNTSCKSKL